MMRTIVVLADVPLMHRVVAMALALLVLGVTVEMIRRRRLREEYAMLWLGTSVVLVVLAAFPQITFWASRTFGITYVTVMVLAVFVFMVMILMQYAAVISRHAEHIRQLTEQVAILKEQLRRANKTDDEGPSPDQRSPDAQGDSTTSDDAEGGGP